jgi:Flp pilus assembly protein TadG
MRMRALPNILSANGGTAAAEFGMIALPLLMLALGVFEFTRLYWTPEALQESATAGARCAGILQSSCAVGGAYNAGNTVTYIQQVASNWGITIPTGDITTTNSTTCGGTAGFSQVQINYTFKTLVPNIIPIGTGGKSLIVQSCYPNNH